MIYLYIKIHNITQLKYLGKTSQNPFLYKGSGKYWRAHIKKHGNNVTTHIVGIFETNDSLKKFSEFYSRLHEIDTSEQWANLKLESGDGGAGPYNPTANKINAKLGGIAKSKLKLTPWNKGISCSRTQESIDKQKKTITGKTRGPYKNYDYSRACPIEYNGVIYPSLSECARKTRVSRRTLKRRLQTQQQAQEP